MEQNKAEEIVRNTELIQENTEEIKKTGAKTYNLERQKRVWEALFYSHQRTDTLLITISGAGIYLCLETIKHYTNNTIPPHWLIKASAILLLCAIIFNFISQIASTRVHGHDYSILDIEITCEEDGLEKKIYQKQINAFEKKINNWNKCSNLFSVAAMILMFLGLSAIVVFFCFIF